jgi:hypothetical protein
MMTTKQAFNPQALFEYQKRYKEMKIKNLERLIDNLKATG